MLPGFKERAGRVYEGLREINIAGGRQRIPTTENIQKRMAYAATSPAELNEMIDLLSEAGYILRIEVDHTASSYPVHALIAQDMDVVKDLKAFALQELEILHEYEMHVKKSADAILRDFTARSPSEGSVSFRRVLALARGLADRTQYMAANPAQFSPSARAERLEQAAQNRSSPSGGSTSVRAVDSPAAAALKQMNLRGEWGRVVRQYGVQFVVRVHLRKHEFDLVTQLIREKQIVHEPDLRYIRDTVRTMESRAVVDPVLKRYLPSIAELRKTAQFRMIQSLRKPVQPMTEPQTPVQVKAAPETGRDFNLDGL